jgi:PKD repeat protein
MKRFFTVFLILLFSLNINTFAQQSRYAIGGFDIGFGLGGSWQQSDIKNSYGSGINVLFGHSLYQTPTSFFALGSRFHLLYGENTAFDHRINPNGTYNNIRYEHVNLDLELVLMLNQLRNRTGIIVSASAGAGFAHNNTHFDLYENIAGSPTPYDYSVINPNNDRRTVYNDLKFLSDDEFETKGITKFALTPTAGLFFGYQFTRHFSMGILHKSNLFIRESDGLYGANIDGIIDNTSTLDINHYTGLVFQWDIGGNEFDVPCIKPSVNFRINKVNRFGSTHELKGSITNISSKDKIRLKIDNIPYNLYIYDSGTNEITANLNLSEGNHVITLSAENECGNDSRTEYIKSESPCEAPDIKLKAEVINTLYGDYKISGMITNITDKSNISLDINGKKNNSFSYNRSSSEIFKNLKLSPGTYTISVTAENECGRDSESLTITVAKPCNKPKMNITVKEVNLLYVGHEIIGTITNITSKSDIDITIDGKPYTAFHYSLNTKELLTKLDLKPGRHNIEIRASNECGQSSENITIFVDEPCNPPEIGLNIRKVNSISATHELSGRITNIFDKSNIHITVNGTKTENFNFKSGSCEVFKALNLGKGTHIITVSAENECGQDSKSFRVSIEEPCDKPYTDVRVIERLSYNSTHEISGLVTNIAYKSDIRITVNGQNVNTFQFNPNTRTLSAKLNLNPGTHTITVLANNDCGSDSQTLSVSVEQPCDPPFINFNVTKINTKNATHELSGSVSNIRNKADLTLHINGYVFHNFQFNPNTRTLSAKLNLNPGTHTITVLANNDCGSDSQTKTVYVEQPCDPPAVNISVSAEPPNKLSGTASNIQNKNDIQITVNGQAFNAFGYNPGNGALSGNLNLSPGNNQITVRVNNDCGSDSETKTVYVEQPCDPPVVNISVSAEPPNKLRGTASNIQNKNDIQISVNGQSFNAFGYNPGNGALSGNLNLPPGNNQITIRVSNDCGSDSQTKTVNIQEQACGPRINPGNADWQFCLITQSGTYNRSDLKNNNFSYTGKASSLFFKAIAGGGDATVNGRPYTLKTGQYYLFTGNLKVTVSTTNPGSMGHWSVCIDADKNPQHGTGGNRPKSPCEIRNENGRSKGRN